MKNWLSFSLLSFVIFMSCEDAQEPSLDRVGLNYYPLEVGNSWVYDVLEVNITLLNQDTLLYDLRETVVDSFTNQSGEPTFILQREKDFRDGGGFQQDSIWSVRKTENSVVVNENNIGLLKLVFPLVDGAEWDGNSFNGGNNRDFSLNFISTDTTVQTNTFSEVIRLVLDDIPNNLTGIDQKYEFYAPDVGLISKDYTTLEYCTRDCTGEFVVEGGRVLKQSLISYE